MTQRWIKAIFQKLWQNLIIRLDYKKKTIRKKRNTFDSISALFEGLELTLNVFRSGIFLMKATKGKGHPLDNR